jgi:acetyl-CoA synthetase
MTDRIESSREEGRDMWWHDLMALPIADWRCTTEVLDSEDPLFMLYTSPTAIRGLMRFGEA